ncbi:MAG: GNAT family N-acetyltransferase [Terracidiphilus sp.]
MSAHKLAFRVRKMMTADVDRVMQIAASLREVPQWPREAYLAALDPQAAPQRIAFVAEDQATGSLAGIAVASLTLPESELETIAVDASFQRRGAARALWAALAADLRAGGASETLLEVRASNLRAQALYLGLGFVEAGRRACYYVDPVEDAVIMRVSLR